MSDYLILVNAARVNGAWSVKLLNYLGHGAPVSNPMQVNPGDRIAWLVQVLIGETRYPLPYHVTFVVPDAKDPTKINAKPSTSFFGVSSLDVPSGGTSDFLAVRSLQSSVAYSIEVKGIGTILDPEVQTGDVSSNGGDRTPVRYHISWDPSRTAMTYQMGGGASNPMPASLPVIYGDLVSFATTPATEFLIRFLPDQNRLWSSPFYQVSGDLPPTGPVTSIPSIQVADNWDATGTAFQFKGVTADGLHTSDVYTLVVNYS